MRRLIALGAVLLLGCTTLEPGYRGLKLRPDVLLALADVQDEFERETAWCLLGRVKGGTVMVEGMAPPIVTDRTTTSATFDCGAWDTLGFAHNHPNEPGMLCVPSGTDVASLDRLGYHVLLISCDGGVFVYRFRGEAETYRLEPEYYGYRGGS